MDIISLALGPIGTNCYIAVKNNEALIFDPGAEPDKITYLLSEKKITPKAIVLTHAHFDHIGAVDHLRTHYDIDVFLHENERDWLGDPNLNRSKSFIGNEIITKPPEQLLVEGELTVASFTFEVKHTPGHSPGSASFIFPNEKCVFGGDVLFFGGIGRTDLPGGDMSQLEASIRNTFYTLDDDFVVYPGHGPKTTIQHEKQNNPFVRL